jgi:hypothetical protein
MTDGPTEKRAGIPTFDPAATKAPTPVRGSAMSQGADPTTRISAEEAQGFARTQAATPPAQPAATPDRTLRLSLEQLFGLFRPVTRTRTRTPHAAPRGRIDSKTPPPRTLRSRQLLVAGVLAASALGGTAYGTTHALLARNRTWVAPTVLSKTDPRVLQLAATLEQETARRQDLLRRKRDIEAQAAGPESYARATVAQALAEVDEQLKRNDALLRTIDASPYRLAIDGDVTLGFVPYENVPFVKKGARLMACKTSLLFCHPVGEVGELLSGEVSGLHPLTGAQMRGQLVRLDVGAGRTVLDSVLYSGQTPLSF